MKLYGHPMATNPRRVGIYLAEKGLDIERVDVNTAAGEHKRPEFLAKNPAGKIPVLELDDGSYLTESAAIVEYLEDRFPEPPMIGVTAEARGRTRAIEQIGNDLIIRAHIVLLHSHAHFAGRTEQNPAVAVAVQPLVDELLGMLEHHLGDNPFLAGQAPTIADCTVFPLFQTCRVRLHLPFGAEYPRLDAWYERFAQRPSAVW